MNKVKLIILLLLVSVVSYTQIQNLEIDIRPWDLREDGGSVKVFVRSVSPDIVESIHEAGFYAEVINSEGESVFKTSEFELQQSEESEEQTLLIWITTELPNNSYSFVFHCNLHGKEETKTKTFILINGKIEFGKIEIEPFRFLVKSENNTLHSQNITLEISSFSELEIKQIQSGKEPLEMKLISSEGHEIEVRWESFNLIDGRRNEYTLISKVEGVESGNYEFYINYKDRRQTEPVEIITKEIPNPIGIKIDFDNPKSIQQKVIISVSGVYEGASFTCMNLTNRRLVRPDYVHYSFEKRHYQLYYSFAQNDAGKYKFFVSYKQFLKMKEFVIEKRIIENPLRISVLERKNIRNTQLGAVSVEITTGSTQPKFSLYDANNIPVPVDKFHYNSQSNKLNFSVSKLKKGNYTILAQDGSFTKKENFTILYEPSPLKVHFTTEHVTHDADANITLTIRGGTRNTSVVCYRDVSIGKTIQPESSSTLSSVTAERIVSYEGLAEGVYYFKIEESGFELYDYVWIGKYGKSTSLSFQPEGNFGQSLNVYKNSAANSEYEINTNFNSEPVLGASIRGHSSSFREQKSLMRWSYVGLENAQIEAATFELFKAGGMRKRNSSLNTLAVYPVPSSELSGDETTNNWNILETTWRSQPLFMRDKTQEIISTSAMNNTSSHFISFDFTSMVSHQSKKVSLNQGFLMELNQPRIGNYQVYYSSYFYDRKRRPRISIKFYVPNRNIYTKVKRELDGAFVRLNKENKLRYAYYEEYNDTDGKLTFRIYNDRNELVMTQDDQSQSISFGENRLILTMDECWINGRFYILEIINEKNEKWYLRFKTFSEDNLKNKIHCISSQNGKNGNTGTQNGGKLGGG